jgi:hypothetical protein
LGGCATAKHYGSPGGSADEYSFIEKHQTIGSLEVKKREATLHDAIPLTAILWIV